MMKLLLLLLLLLVLPTLSSASPLDMRSATERENVSFINSELNGNPKITVNTHRSLLPLVTVAKRMQKREVRSSSSVSGDGSNLEWVTWNNTLPDNAVSIYNDYGYRLDYVCKYRCDAGYYAPSIDSYCHYPNANKAHSGSPFEILVNKNNLEILEWKEDSSGSVPQNSVKTCPKGNIYVGKNKYGLGKVNTKEKRLDLPWNSDERRYSSYQVLTTDTDIISQQIYDVRYITDESTIFHFPPETLRKTSVSNYGCRSVVKTDSLSKTYQVEHNWDMSVSVQTGFETTFTVNLLSIVSGSIMFSTEVTTQYSKGKTVTEAITSTVSVQITAPPNSSCLVKMVEYKSKVNVPFTASLKRTYANGEIHTTSITGTYDSVQVGEVLAVADRCELLVDSKPCT